MIFPYRLFCAMCVWECPVWVVATTTAAVTAATMSTPVAKRNRIDDRNDWVADGKVSALEIVRFVIENKRQTRIGTSELTCSARIRATWLCSKEQSLVNLSKDIPKKRVHFVALSVCVSVCLCVWINIMDFRCFMTNVFFSFLFARFQRRQQQMSLANESHPYSVWLLNVCFALPTPVGWCENIFQFYQAQKQQNTFHWRLINGYFPLQITIHRIFKFIFQSILSKPFGWLSITSFSSHWLFSNKLVGYFHPTH